MTSCPICDNSSTEFYVIKNNYPFNRCKKCDFVFLLPMPNQNTLNEQYENTNDSLDKWIDQGAMNEYSNNTETEGALITEYSIGKAIFNKCV